MAASRRHSHRQVAWHNIRETNRSSNRAGQSPPSALPSAGPGVSFATPAMSSKPVFLYDTTLRDGTQGEGFQLSGLDKLRIAQRLDAFGIDYIEGGWPGSNPKDIEFFREAKNLNLKHAKLAAFGSTRRADLAVAATTPRCACCSRRRPRWSPFSAKAGSCRSPRSCAPRSRKTAR